MARRHQGAEQAVIFVVDSRCEVQNVGRARGCAVSEFDSPQAFDLNRLTILTVHHALKFAGFGVERGDVPAAKLPDQQLLAQLSKAAWRLSHTPRRVQEVAVFETSHEHA